MSLIKNEMNSWSAVLSFDKGKLQDNDHDNVMVSPAHVFLYAIFMLVTNIIPDGFFPRIRLIGVYIRKYLFV